MRDLKDYSKSHSNTFVKQKLIKKQPTGTGNKQFQGSTEAEQTSSS